MAPLPDVHLSFRHFIWLSRSGEGYILISILYPYHLWTRTMCFHNHLEIDKAHKLNLLLKSIRRWSTILSFSKSQSPCCWLQGRERSIFKQRRGTKRETKNVRVPEADNASRHVAQCWQIIPNESGLTHDRLFDPPSSNTHTQDPHSKCLLMFHQSINNTFNRDMCLETMLTLSRAHACTHGHRERENNA